MIREAVITNADHAGYKVVLSIDGIDLCTVKGDTYRVETHDYGKYKLYNITVCVKDSTVAYFMVDEFVVV